MKQIDPNLAYAAQPAAELELYLQEAHAQRQRAAELFGEPDWQDEEQDDDE